MNIPSHLHFALSTSLELRTGKYSNGRLAIQALDRDTGEHIATLTVNIPDVHLAPDEVLIKDYAENLGALETLVRAGILVHRSTVPCGHTTAALCVMLKEIV